MPPALPPCRGSSWATANASAPSPCRPRSTCCAAELRGGRRRRAPVSRSESPESLQLRTISVRGGRKGDYFAERPGLLAAQGMVQEVLHEQPLVQGLEIVGEAVIQHPQVEIQVVNDAPAFGQRCFHRDAAILDCKIEIGRASCRER